MDSVQPKLSRDHHQRIRYGVLWGMLIGVFAGSTHVGFETAFKAYTNDFSTIIWAPFAIFSYMVVCGVAGALIGRWTRQKYFHLLLIVFAVVACLVGGYYGHLLGAARQRYMDSTGPGSYGL